MANARPIGLRRATGSAAAALVLLAIASTEGCSCSNNDSNPSGGTTTSSGAGGGAAISIAPAAHGSSFKTPFDAAPDPNGTEVYFTAMTPDGAPGIFKAPADGSGAATAIASGDPLVAPIGIAISPDGTTLYVADPAARASSTSEDGGTVFSLATSGGTPTRIMGTEGFKPRGVEVRDDGKAVSLLFSGVDPKVGHASVFAIPTGGGSPTDAAGGAALMDPSGIAVAADGTIFVADAITGTGAARVVALKASGASDLASDLAVGYPAGVALTKDDTTLLVSGLDTDKGTDVVFLIDIASGEATTFTKDIDTYVEAAGLHRARGADVFAWADSRAQSTGTVFVVRK